MTLRVNGEPREVPDALSIQGLVAWLGAPPLGVAVAVNGAVIPRAEHGEHVLVAGDRVEVIRAVGGG